MLYRSQVLSNQTNIREFIADSMQDFGYTLVLNDATHLGFTIKNSFNTPTGTDAYFTPMFILDGTNVGVTLASQLPSTNLIPTANAPKVTTHNTDVKVDLLVTNFNVCLAVTKQSTGQIVSFVITTVDYRELDLDAIGADTTHLNNLRNNLQAVFRVGDENSGRLLYTGSIGSYTYNGALTVDTPSLNSTPFLMQGSQLNLPISVCLVINSGKYFGSFKSVYLTKNASPFHRDRGVDQSGISHVFFRDSVNNAAVMIGEA